MPDSMLALVVEAPGRFEVRSVPVPQPGPMEVLCRVRAVAICGTDPHIIEGHHIGHWPKAWPYIPGHEWSGEVVALGPGVEGFGWRVGDRVAGTSHVGCGYCLMCRSGRYNLCENYGREDLGHRQYGHYSQGAYAEYVVHNIKSVFRLPDAISFDEGALVDTVSIALWSAKRGRINAGDTVAVVGAGPMGILVGQCAFALGAARVVMVGSGERLRRSAPYATWTVDYRAEDPVARVRELTGGGAHVSIDCAGTKDSIEQAVAMTRKGGRVVFTGVPHQPAELPMQKIVLEELDLYGVRANRNTCEESIALMETGRIDVKGLITHHFPLTEYRRAYEVFTQRIDGALKVIVHP
ncbi:MAG: alcohol dehydrogenase catalytic domain-containing protein [Firmicutes bacterium]|nr:alcohol dehydrogenase catalytic domain-containing protein [Bacillota bacterium]